MPEFREGDTVIVCEQGPTGGGIARLARISSIKDGVAWVDNRRFSLDVDEPWDIPASRSNVIRYVLKADTPDNRKLYGLA